MKPNDGTYAQNALKHGVAGLNIDRGRIPVDPNDINRRPHGSVSMKDSEGGMFGAGGRNPEIGNDTLDVNKGRFPANVILDEFAAATLDEQSGTLKSGASKNSYIGNESKNRAMSDKNYQRVMPDLSSSQGGASRFFYCAKASGSEREKFNTHPTVKPLKLIEYLCFLTMTPSGGIVLDPFLGSGTTAIACENLNRPWTGIEKEEKYCEIAARRIEQVASQMSF